MKLVEIIVPRFRVLDREMAAREEFRTLPKAVRDQRRLERLNDRWCAAVHGSRFYAKLARELGLPELFESLDEFRELVPITPREALRDWPDDFRLPWRRRGKWMTTGGSTATWRACGISTGRGRGGVWVCLTGRRCCGGTRIRTGAACRAHAAG